MFHCECEQKMLRVSRLMFLKYGNETVIIFWGEPVSRKSQ